MIIYSKISIDRKPKFRLITSIEEKNKVLFVRKKAAEPQAQKFLLSMIDTYKKVKDISKTIKLVEPKVEGNSLIFPFINGENLRDKFKDYYLNGDDEKALDMLVNFKKIIEDFPTIKPNLEQNKIYKSVFGSAIKRDEELAFSCLDLNLDNLIEYNGKLYLIDYEWFFDIPLPKNFLYFRTFFYSFASIKELLKVKAGEFPIVQLTSEVLVPKKVFDAQSFKITDLKRFYGYEIRFQEYVRLIKKSDGKLQKIVNYKIAPLNAFEKINLLERSIDENTMLLKDREIKLEQIKRELRGVYGSRSWKLTSGLRKLKRLGENLNRKLTP